MCPVAGVWVLKRKHTDHPQATWVFVILGNLYDIKTGEWSTSAHALISGQEMWFAVFMTVLYVAFQFLTSFVPLG